MAAPASLGIIALVLVWSSATMRFVLIDDAYISFRYAANLASFGELVFNRGERVEAITNLLWTLLLAVQARVLHSPTEYAAVVLSLALVAVACLRIWQTGVILGLSPLAAISGAILLPVSAPFMRVAGNGLEAGLFTALLAEMTYRYAGNRINWAFVACGLLFMTRPEAAAFGLILVALVWLEQRTLRSAYRGLLLFGGIVIVVTCLRLLYYGSAVPNGVVAKSFPIRLLLAWFLRTSIEAYLRGFITHSPYLILIAFLALLSLLLAHRLPSRSYFVMLFCLAGIALSYIVAIRNGGDWMPDYRLLWQYGVLYAVLLSVLLSLLLRHRVFHTAAVLAALVSLALVAASAPYGYRRAIEASPLISISAAARLPFWAEAVTRLRPVLAESDTVSAEAIGYIGYHLPDQRIHDPLGLADAYLARHGSPIIPYGKQDASYTLGTVRPSVLVWHYAGHLQGVRQELLDEYVAFCAADCSGWDADLVMIRRDRLDTLAPPFADWEIVKVEPTDIVPLGSNSLP